MERDEHRAHGVRQTLVHGETVARPIGRGAEATQLIGDGAAGFLFPAPYALDKRFAPEIARGTVSVLRGTSHEMLPKLEGLDWIYVDGDHSAAAVRDDCALALRAVRARTGLLIFDDFDWEDAGANNSRSVEAGVAACLRDAGARASRVLVKGGQCIIRREA